MSFSPRIMSDKRLKQIQRMHRECVDWWTGYEEFAKMRAAVGGLLSYVRWLRRDNGGKRALVAAQGRTIWQLVDEIPTEEELGRLRRALELADAMPTTEKSLIIAAAEAIERLVVEGK